MAICHQCIFIIENSAEPRALLSSVRRHLDECSTCVHTSVIHVLAEISIGPKAAKYSGMIARIGIISLIGHALRKHPHPAPL